VDWDNGYSDLCPVFGAKSYSGLAAYVFAGFSEHFYTFSYNPVGYYF